MAGNLVLLAIVLFACSPAEQVTQDQVPPRDSLPVLVGDTVTTLISDSGIPKIDKTADFSVIQKNIRKTKISMG